MYTLHNTRILRFLVMLGAVILMIFIYASYSSNTTPPHLRTAAPGSAEALNQDLLLFQQQERLLKQLPLNRTDNEYPSVENLVLKGQHTANTSDNNNNNNNYNNNNNNNNNLEHAANKKKFGFIRKQHRLPTIDADAPGGDVNNNNNNNNDAVDDIGNDLMEEQYAQNADGVQVSGNIVNNTLTMNSIQQQQQQQQQQERQQEQHQIQLEQDGQQQQHAPQVQMNAGVGTGEVNSNLLMLKNNNNNNNNNNLNKISDSEVLIPTSNLQKFIENADKILKNISTNNPTAANANKDEAHAGSAKELNFIPPGGINVNENEINLDDDADDSADGAALPPSVVMKIKERSSPNSAPADKQPPPPPPQSPQSQLHVSAQAIQKASGVTKSNQNNIQKVTQKTNTTTPKAAIDTTQGIPTQQIYESGHMNEELNIEKLCPNEGADIKLLIIITSAQSHAEARLAIRQTWGHYGVRRDISTAFILGRTTNESVSLALTQENFIYGDLIRGHFIDSYNNLTLKTISSLEWVDQHCKHAKYILKTDDDMFINVPKLLTFLDSHSKEKRVIYGRLAKKWKPIRNKKSKYYVSTGQFGAPVFPPFTTGPAYVLTSDIVHELYVHSLQQVYFKLEDVFTTGIVSQQLGIKRVHVNEFLNRRIPLNPCNIRKTISVHMIKANEQFDLWKKLLDQTTKCK